MDSIRLKTAGDMACNLSNSSVRLKIGLNIRNKYHPFFMKIPVVFLLLLASSVNAGVYKWTDKKGNVHYSDHPIEQGNATELNINTESGAGITNSSANRKERDRMIHELEGDRKAREKTREESRAAQLKKQKRCAQSKDSLRKYQNASSIYKLNSKGDRVYYSREEREAKEQKLNRSITRYCR
jgi:hypothetical protein